MVLYGWLPAEPNFSRLCPRSGRCACSISAAASADSTSPRAPYLQPDDTYTGIDVGKSFIEICRARYTDPNVTFVHLDASNPYYASHYSDKKLPWPFEDDGFNFMTALSVWTHLNEGDFTFYLKELGRTLAPPEAGRWSASSSWTRFTRRRSPAGPLRRAPIIRSPHQGGSLTRVRTAQGITSTQMGEGSRARYRRH